MVRRILLWLLTSCFFRLFFDLMNTAISSAGGRYSPQSPWWPWALVYALSGMINYVFLQKRRSVPFLALINGVWFVPVAIFALRYAEGVSTAVLIETSVTLPLVTAMLLFPPNSRVLTVYWEISLAALGFALWLQGTRPAAPWQITSGILLYFMLSAMSLALPEDDFGTMPMETEGVKSREKNITVGLYVLAALILCIVLGVIIALPSFQGWVARSLTTLGNLFLRLLDLMGLNRPPAYPGYESQNRLPARFEEGQSMGGDVPLWLMICLWVLCGALTLFLIYELAVRLHKAMKNYRSIRLPLIRPVQRIDHRLNLFPLLAAAMRIIQSVCAKVWHRVKEIIAPDQSVFGLYHYFLGRMRSAGFPKKPDETPSEFLLRLAQSLQGYASGGTLDIFAGSAPGQHAHPAIVTITRMFVEARYGGRSNKISRVEYLHLRRFLRTLKVRKLSNELSK